jgi:ribosome-associated protein
MLEITRDIVLPDHEIELNSIRAQGSGGQKVNKTSSAVHLRFDIRASSLPDNVKQKLLASSDSRISKEGILIIKAQQYRTLEQNRQNALERLQQLIQSTLVTRKARRATRPTRSSQRKRMDSKTKHSRLKQLRRRTDY